MSEDFYKEKLDAKEVISKMEIATPHGTLEKKAQTWEVRFCR